MGIVIRRNRTASALTDAEARQLHEQISNLAIELVPIESVKPNPRNAKQHPSRQIVLIAESIKQFGFNHPLLVDEDGMVFGGHARIAAAHRLNLKLVPVLRFTNLSPQEKRAVALAENKLPELGDWDVDMLRSELKELTIDVPDLVFDYSITGFDTGEIDQILAGELPASRADPADHVPAVQDDEVAVTEPGDSSGSAVIIALIAVVRWKHPPIVRCWWAHPPIWCLPIRCKMFPVSEQAGDPEHLEVRTL
jgi:hypothetical protein